MSNSINHVKEAMENYWVETSMLAKGIADTISFQRQPVTDREMESLLESNAGLRAANNVLVEIRRESDIPLVSRLDAMMDTALRSGTAHLETVRVYNDVIKTLTGQV